MSVKCVICGADATYDGADYYCNDCDAWCPGVVPMVSTEVAHDKPPFLYREPETPIHTVIDSHMTSTGPMSYHKIEPAGFNLNFDRCYLLVKRDGTMEINGEWDDVAKMFWNQLSEMGVGYAKQNEELKAALNIIKTMSTLPDAEESRSTIGKLAAHWLEVYK